MDSHNAGSTSYISVLGSELGQIFQELQDDFGGLGQKWLEHRGLFDGGQDRIDLLNAVASSFFFFLNNLFYESVSLHLCRLTDRLQSCRKVTLTIMRLQGLITDPKLKAVVQMKAKTAKQRCEFARHLRNKKLAHTDLANLRIADASIIADINSSNVEGGMNAIEDVLTAVTDHHDLPPSLGISNPWGSKSIVGCL
jgi:AbiU2